MIGFVIRLLPYAILTLAVVTWFTARELGEVFDERASTHRLLVKVFYILLLWRVGWAAKVCFVETRHWVRWVFVVFNVCALVVVAWIGAGSVSLWYTTIHFKWVAYLRELMVTMFLYGLIEVQVWRAGRKTGGSG